MTRHLLDQIIRSKPELSRLPVLANVDFGRTTPMITFPIGGTVGIKAVDPEPRMTITTH